MGEIWVAYGHVQITPKYRPNKYRGLCRIRGKQAMFRNMGNYGRDMGDAKITGESLQKISNFTTRMSSKS